MDCFSLHCGLILLLSVANKCLFSIAHKSLSSFPFSHDVSSSFILSLALSRSHCLFAHTLAVARSHALTLSLIFRHSCSFSVARIVLFSRISCWLVFIRPLSLNFSLKHFLLLVPIRPLCFIFSLIHFLLLVFPARLILSVLCSSLTYFLSGLFVPYFPQ